MTGRHAEQAHRRRGGKLHDGDEGRHVDVVDGDLVDDEHPPRAQAVESDDYGRSRIHHRPDDVQRRR